MGGSHGKHTFNHDVQQPDKKATKEKRKDKAAASHPIVWAEQSEAGSYSAPTQHHHYQPDTHHHCQPDTSHHCQPDTNHHNDCGGNSSSATCGDS